MFLWPIRLRIISGTYLVMGDILSWFYFLVNCRNFCFLYLFHEGQDTYYHHIFPIKLRRLYCQLCHRLQFLRQIDHCFHYNGQLYFSSNHVLEPVWNIAFSSVFVPLKADSHIACRAHAVSMHFPCHAAPLLCSDSAVSFVKVRMVAGNIRPASPTV